ncbi:hypothetical protein R1sor_026535 [Riccia sorocarpa]|uniref:Uncharacterized protein n=1 Tax=Riccia sorocarpa TaxID=122646 RepID=A0ABD3GDC8_9MARC
MEQLIDHVMRMIKFPPDNATYENFIKAAEGLTNVFLRFLVLIDDNPYLVRKARHCGTSQGFSVVQQQRLIEHYSILVLEKPRN